MARIANDAANTSLLYESMFKPGRRSKSTMPGKSRHQLKLNTARNSQKQFIER